MTKSAPERKKNPAAQALAHRRAAKLSPERLSEIGRAGAEKRWAGHEKKKKEKS